jgi:TetR/AcrR family transcriptional regulator, transcriptional repressor of bet genes
MDGNTARSARHTTAQRRAQIAQAALDCLSEDGPSGLTARRIAAKAGISLGHLTYHFTNMDEVMVEAYQLAAGQLAQTEPLEDLKGLSATDRLIKYLQAVYAPQTLTKTRIALRVNLWSAAQTNPAIATIERALHEALRSQIEAHLTAICDPWKTGRIPMVEAFIMATLDGLWLDYMRHGDLEAIDAAIDAAGQFAKIRLGGS